MLTRLNPGNNMKSTYVAQLRFISAFSLFVWHFDRLVTHQAKIKQLSKQKKHELPFLFVKIVKGFDHGEHMLQASRVQFR